MNICPDLAPKRAVVLFSVLLNTLCATELLKICSLGQQPPDALKIARKD